MKCIKIATCMECPFREHGGGFGSPSYKPLCGKKNGKALPYKTVESDGFLVAEIKGTIPSWCPLETLKES